MTAHELFRGHPEIAAPMRKLAHTQLNGWTMKEWSDFVTTISRLTAENSGLRKMVRGAYEEGFSEGMREHTSYNGGKGWHESKTAAALVQITTTLPDAESPRG